VALEGSLRDFGLADILQLIFFQRKTGLLTLEGRTDKIRLLFIDGNIIGAESKRRIEANRLGKVLMKKGLLSEADLQSVLEEQQSSNAKIGNILIRKGLVPKEQIQGIIEGQIQETVIQIFAWKEGSYEFTPQAVPVDKDIPITIDTQHILMEGLRIVDELTLIEGKITLDTVFIKKAAATKDLSGEEKEILSLVDGENDVSTIIDISGKDDFSVSKTLVSLIEQGIIETREVLPVVSEVPVRETKKTVFAYRFLPAVAIMIAVLVALSSVVLSSGHMVRRYLASHDIDDIRFKIEVFKCEHGSYPETLDAVRTRPDPWGNPYRYDYNNYTFVVFSTGPDGSEKSPDDIY
jgi:predicted transcriptional regulator